MRTKFYAKPRKFRPIKGLTLKDMGEVFLDIDEQVTFRTKSGRKNDVVQKSWGFYISNSLNHNLKNQGFKVALALSRAGGNARLFVNLVEKEKMKSFLSYIKRDKSEIICWLDEWFRDE